MKQMTDIRVERAGSMKLTSFYRAAMIGCIAGVYIFACCLISISSHEFSSIAGMVLAFGLILSVAALYADRSN